MTYPPFDDRPTPAELRESSRTLFGVGIFVMIASVAIYFVLTQLEQNGGNIPAPAILVLLYEFAGKEVLAILLFLTSVYYIYSGYCEWLASRQ